MLRIYVDADSMTERQRSIILRRVIGNPEAECVFAADRSLPDVVRAIADDKAMRRKPFRDTLSPEEIRKIGSGIRMEVVEKGSNAADDYLVSIAEEGGVAVTHDIPLSERLIAKGLIVIDDRGGRLTQENIRARMSERENNAIFREMGLFEARQKRIDERTVREFAAAFDKAVSEAEKRK